jgi:hypothetical protein
LQRVIVALGYKALDDNVENDLGGVRFADVDPQ